MVGRKDRKAGLECVILAGKKQILQKWTSAGMVMTAVPIPADACFSGKIWFQTPAQTIVFVLSYIFLAK